MRLRADQGREYVAPALRELAFRRGSSLGAFRYETAMHAAEIRFQKSWHSTREEVDFWVLVRATDSKPEFTYFDGTLADLPSGWPDAGNCTIRAGDPVGRVGRAVVDSLRTTAWTAIQAALDTPGYPRDPAGRVGAGLPQAREAMEAAEARADTDPGLLARLETDPHPEIRQEAAWWLRHRPVRNAAAGRCGPLRLRMRTPRSRWIASPGTRSGSLRAGNPDRGHRPAAEPEAAGAEAAGRAGPHR